MKKKLRVGGETIDPKRTYCGDRVLDLLQISYDNGYRRGVADSEEVARDNYAQGYQDGYSGASEDIIQLRALLSRILNLGG